MARYRVELVRAKTVYETVSLEVVADNQRHARRMARDKYYSSPGLKLDWVPDPRPDEHGIRIHSVERLAEEQAAPAPKTEPPKEEPPTVPTKEEPKV